MKRLIKKAVDMKQLKNDVNPQDYLLQDHEQQHELYHYTSLRHFIDMMNEGQISPGGFNGNVSGGGHKTHYSLDGQGKKSGKYVVELLAIQSSTNIVLDPDVLSKIEELRAKFPDEDEFKNQIIQVVTSNPSHNQTGIYLTNKIVDREGYGDKAVEKHPEKNLPNTPVMLTVLVNEDTLGPDLDDSSVSEKSSIPYYQQTLDKVGQCLHNGPIPLEQLMGVTIDRSGWTNTNKFYTPYDFASWAEQYLDTGITLSSEIAYQGTQEMDTAYNELDPNQKQLMK